MTYIDIRTCYKRQERTDFTLGIESQHFTVRLPDADAVFETWGGPGDPS